MRADTRRGVRPRGSVGHCRYWLNGSNRSWSPVAASWPPRCSFSACFAAVSYPLLSSTRVGRATRWLHHAESASAMAGDDGVLATGRAALILLLCTAFVPWVAVHVKRWRGARGAARRGGDADDDVGERAHGRDKAAVAAPPAVAAGVTTPYDGSLPKTVELLDHVMRLAAVLLCVAWAVSRAVCQHCCAAVLLCVACTVFCPCRVNCGACCSSVCNDSCALTVPPRDDARPTRACMVADSAPFAPHGGRTYDRDTFVFLCMLLLLVCAFTVKPGRGAAVLNRDQTEEWKGWMQVRSALR